MWRFVLLTWVLWWGTCMIAIASAFGAYATGRFSLRELYTTAPAYLIIALLAGLTVWFIGEHQYRRSVGGG
ncbi:MAG TPA: hypothetical protein VL484_20700 [Vicinamibacterales bacterium]|nr:hypothetical protein [Vicinamibacterales bacterium]